MDFASSLIIWPACSCFVFTRSSLIYNISWALPSSLDPINNMVCSPSSLPSWKTRFFSSFWSVMDTSLRTSLIPLMSSTACFKVFLRSEAFASSFSSSSCLKSRISACKSLMALMGSEVFFNSCLICVSWLSCSLIYCSAASAVTASILRTPAAMAVSLIILNKPIRPVSGTWQPPHNSIENSGSKVIILTFSPYFSPKSILAPDFSASDIGRSRSSWRWIFSLIFWLTRASIFMISSGETLEKCEKSNRRYVSVTNDPRWATWSPSTSLRAACSKCVAEWLFSMRRLRRESITVVTSPFNPEGKFLVMWMGKSFSLTTSRTSMASLPNLIIPVSPTCPPPSG